jgi:hypothetical protein
MWANSYENILLEWTNLREEVHDLPLAAALHKVQDWWAQAPLVDHYLHIVDYDEWPLPWDLLAENTYCEIAKCLGMCYTLLLIKHEEINSLHIVQTDNYCLLQINDGRYTLNDQPGEIMADQADIHVKYSINCEYFKNKLE